MFLIYKISIVCPVYNCELYIERTINSLMNQSIGFENLELIFVDDASTDSSKEIIEKYSSKYDNIKLYCSKRSHGFPGFGRNLGMKKASSDYIMFIDNDDEYFEDYCEVMYDTIVSEDVDCVASNYVILEKSKTIKKNFFNQINGYKRGNDKIFVDLNEFFYLKGSEVWSKIFKKSIIESNDIKFIESGLNEDTLFLYEYYHYSDKLLYIDYYGYKWHRDGENLSYNSVKTTLTFIKSYYDIVNLMRRLNCNVDLNRLFKDEINMSMYRIAFSYENKDELKEMILKLYDFESYIGFNGSLNNFAFTFINNSIINNHLSRARIFLTLLRKLKVILDHVRKLKIK